jgi:hypothetical protein
VTTAAALDSVTTYPPFPLRGARVLPVSVRLPINVPVSHVIVDYTPAADVHNADQADPLVKKMVVNTSVFPVTRRTGASDPWFSLTPNWVKLSVSTRGMYTVTGSDLAAAGIALASIDPATLRLFSSGGLNQPRLYSDSTGTWNAGHAMREVPVRVEGGGDGTFEPGDRVVFYGLATRDWADYYDASDADTVFHEHTHAKTNVYFLAWGGALGGAPLRIADAGAAPTGAADVTTYLHREYRERDLFSDYDFRGDGWLWLDIGSPSNNRIRLTPAIDVRNLVTTVPQRFRTVALAKFVNADEPTGSNIGHRAVYYNFRGGQEVLVGQKVWNGTGGDNFYESGRPVLVDTLFLADGSNEFRLQVPGNRNPEDRMLFAWFSVFYERRIRAVGNAVAFTSDDTTDVVNFRADNFTGTDAIHVFDVTDAWNPVRLTGFEETSGGGGRVVRFSAAPAGVHRHYWAATTAGLTKPTIARVTPTELRADATGPNMLIITHDDFRAAAERLRTYRAGNRVPFFDNPTVEVVTVDDIFDNFSQGVPDPMAIRNFIKFAYENYIDANGNPRLGYVCFLGDATTDFQNYASTQPDFVPSNLYFAQLAPYTFATDEWFGHMDAADQVAGRDVLDVAIGRLPAASVAEAEFLVDRVIGYETQSPMEPWREEVILVADDENSSFESCESQWTDESEQLAAINLPNFVSTTKIYLTEYTLIAGVKPASRFRFLDEWDHGALLISFIGHGSSVQMADEQVFLGSDVSQLDNGLKLPLMMAFSCTIGDFANPAGKSLSEKLLLHDNGGAIGAITASREAYPGPNSTLNTAIFDRLLPRRLGAGVLPLGVGLMQAKSQAQVNNSFSPFSSENSWKYNLMGDPATTMRVPLREIRFRTEGADTMVAGARASLRGAVYTDGMLDPSFSGTAYVTVREPMLRRSYDPACSSSNINYSIPGGVMYDGTTDVTNGEFEVSFRVPRYAATGPLAGASAYAYQASVDAGATMDSVLVIVSPTLEDSLALRPLDGAPRVSLGFKSGLTVVKPGDTVRAVVRDQDGINILTTTNEGKQAMLIDDLPLPIDVNEFFTFDHGGIDTSGVLLFPLPELATGKHRLVYKVSDSFGATTLDTLSFSVTEAADYYAEAVLNYPNPFQTSTQLLFRLSDRASIQLDIFTVSGKRVRRIQDMRDGGEAWIEWDGRDGAGGDIANGTYLYVATVDFVGLERAPVVLRGKMSKVR